MPFADTLMRLGNFCKFSCSAKFCRIQGKFALAVKRSDLTQVVPSGSDIQGIPKCRLHTRPCSLVFFAILCSAKFCRGQGIHIGG